MNNLNRCEFIGHLGDYPEIRYTRDGDPVASFSIACNWKTKKNEGVEWVNLTAFGRLAEIIEDYLEKGSKVYVSGRLQTESYEDKHGDKKYFTKVVVNELEMLDSKRDDRDDKNDRSSRRNRDDRSDKNRSRSRRDRDDNDDRSARRKRSRREPDEETNSGHDAGFEDDDIPF